MLFPLYAGFEPILPRWLSAGWKRYNMHMYCEGHPLNLSTLTLHRPQTSNLFSHIFACTVSLTGGHLETIVVASHY